ncbi:hypothetical protein BDQ17DRAFT_138003 [Cyathus striatus]|nr:hypothetical protein BDQ17DRAFT_138003 [Cyathus striatus]
MRHITLGLRGPDSDRCLVHEIWIVGQFGQQISLSAINLYPLYLMVMDNLSREIRGSEKKYTCSSEMGQGLKRMRRQNGHRRLCQSSFQRIQGLHCSRDSNSALGVIIFKLRQLHIKPLNFFIVLQVSVYHLSEASAVSTDVNSSAGVNTFWVAERGIPFGMFTRTSGPLCSFWRLSPLRR